MKSFPSRIGWSPFLWSIPNISGYCDRTEYIVPVMRLLTLFTQEPAGFFPAGSLFSWRSF